MIFRKLQLQMHGRSAVAAFFVTPRLFHIPAEQLGIIQSCDYRLLLPNAWQTTRYTTNPGIEPMCGRALRYHCSCLDLDKAPWLQGRPLELRLRVGVRLVI